MSTLAFDLSIPPEPRRLETRSGAVVAIVERDGAEHIEVRDASAQLLIELDPETGRTTIAALRGPLSLAAPEGDIELAAGGTVRIAGKRGVELETKTLRVTAGKASLGIADLRFAGTALRAKLEEAVVAVGRLETVSERLFERAKNVYRQAEDLYQLKAGRLRTLVEEGYSLKAGHASVVAREEVKIDGSQIHLG